MSKKLQKILPKSQTSYHQSLDHCLYIPGVGHVAPVTYSGYGSLLHSDDDNDNEATSKFYSDQNTFVPDSLVEEVPSFDEKADHCVDNLDACGYGKGYLLETARSGDLSPSSKKFSRFCDKFLEKKRKREEKRVLETIKADDVVQHKAICGGSCGSGDLSPKSMKFKKFCDKYLKPRKKNC